MNPMPNSKPTLSQHIVSALIKMNNQTEIALSVIGPEFYESIFAVAHLTTTRRYLHGKHGMLDECLASVEEDGSALAHNCVSVSCLPSLSIYYFCLSEHENLATPFYSIEIRPRLHRLVQLRLNPVSC